MRWSGPGNIVGRVFPRHGHRGRPFKSVVKLQKSPISNAIACTRNYSPTRFSLCVQSIDPSLTIKFVAGHQIKFPADLKFSHFGTII